MGQETFNPVSFGFEWTNDGWYKWDGPVSHKLALKARNARMKELRKAGHRPKGSSLPGQLITRGGIGTPYPHIENVVTVYVINY